MDDSRIARLYAQAWRGQLSRRQIVHLGLRLGLATPVITGLLAAAPARAGRAAAPARAQDGESCGTFTALITDGTEDLDPHSSYSTLASTVALAVYETLILYKGESTSEFEPSLAESWEVGDDQSTYTFHLVPDARFHDGTPADAEAVKSSFTRFLEMGLGPVNVISRFVESADQIEVVDRNTVRFNLGQPQPLFLAAMASSYGPFVVSPTAVEEHKTEADPWANEWFRFNAVGTGPYELVENSLNEGIVLAKFDDYHGGWEGRHYDRIVLRVVPENATRRQLIEQGEADGTAFPNLTFEDVAAMADNPDLQVIRYPSTNVSWTIMNAVTLPREARIGFSYAFPYQDVVEGVYKGFLDRSGPIPESVRGADPDVFVYETDLQRAKELLEQAGFEEGSSFTYMIDSADEVSKAVAQLFQANLQQIGYDLEIQGVDYSTVENTVFGDAPGEQKPDFIAWGWWPDYNDPWNQLAPNFLEEAAGGGGSNAGYWVNERFEEIMAEAEHFEDENRLAELMKEAQNILTEQDPPAIYHGQVQWWTVLRNDVRGFVANPLYLGSYPFYDMTCAAPE